MDGGYELNPKLKDDAEKVFDAGIEKLDFNNGAYCANLINKWVRTLVVTSRLRGHAHFNESKCLSHIRYAMNHITNGYQAIEC